jgi:hypothetical protein
MSLITRAQEIKNETVNGANTALRVGSLFEDISKVVEKNINSFGNIYMKNNEVETIITTQFVRVPVAGVTVFNEISQHFNHDADNNALRYIGEENAVFHINASFTLIPASTNQKYGIYIGVNKGGAIDATADRISESEVYISTPQTGRSDAAAVQALVQLEPNDRVYIIAQNVTGTANVTFEFLNIIIK